MCCNRRLQGTVSSKRLDGFGECRTLIPHKTERRITCGLQLKQGKWNVSDCSSRSTISKFMLLIRVVGTTACIFAASEGTDSMWAAKGGHAECLRVLLVVGANVHAPNKYGKTALKCAEDNKHSDCVALL